jgi:hypothetical protein
MLPEGILYIHPVSLGYAIPQMPKAPKRTLAKRTGSLGRPITSERPVEMHDLVRLHMEGSARLKDLLAECTRYRDKADKAKAKQALAQAEGVKAALHAMEKALAR